VTYCCCNCGFRVSTTDERPQICPQCDEKIFTHQGSDDLILMQVELE